MLDRNGKGDLIQRVVDGERPVFVDECHAGVSAGLTSLDGVSCGTADTSFYTYEATGELQKAYDPRAYAQLLFSDPNHRLAYTYDTLGRPVKIHDPDLEGTGFALTTFSDAGTIASTTNARGEQRSFVYDILGRLEGVTTPWDEEDYTVTYRPTERQRKMDSSQSYERVRTYDGFGRVTQSQLSVVEATGPLVGTWSATYLTGFEHDALGRLVEVHHPESTTVRYEYEGAYLKRVCDLGSADDCSDPSVVEYVGNVEYDELGRREITEMAAGNRTFTYDGSLPRLATDAFTGSSDPYTFQRSFDTHDELGNVTAITGSSLPGDIDLNESFEYDSRNRLDTWIKEGTSYDYGYDDLGNLKTHAGAEQLFTDAGRPHAIQDHASGTATYGYDEDGNVTSIVDAATRFFTFDSANRLVCVDDSVANGCGVSRIHYDVDGKRVLDDKPNNLDFVAYIDDSVKVNSTLGTLTRIEILAFGERIALKTSPEPMRVAVLIPFSVPPIALHVITLLGLAGLLAWAQRRGTLVLVFERPLPAGVASVLVVALILGPVPIARAGGGGGTAFYWELADRLGTGMVLLDETGARMFHRTYSPFGVEHASVGTGSWHLTRYAGHMKDEDSGLVYMQARWMDPQTGTFLSIDPLVADAGDPQSYNAYAYARNNPITNTDPTGACIMSDCGYWYGQLPDGMSPNQAANGYAAVSIENGPSGVGGPAEAAGAGGGATVGNQPVSGTSQGNGSGQSVPVVPESAVEGPAPQEVGVGSFLGRLFSLVARSRFVATRLPWLAGPGAVAASKFATDPSRAALIQRLVASDGSLRVSNTVAQRMATPGRFVPNDAILRVVGSGSRGVDPQGVAGQFMYRGPGLSPHGNPGTLEVLVNEQIGVINHVLFKSGPK